MSRIVRLALGPLALVLVAGVAIISCQAAPGRTTTIPFVAQNESGVTGTVKLTELNNGKTRLEINVDPAGQPDMPAHVHVGICGNLVPQPKFPLENALNGHSVTEVPATLAELTNGTLALNLHRSVEDLKTSTACADLR